MLKRHLMSLLLIHRCWNVTLCHCYYSTGQSWRLPLSKWHWGVQCAWCEEGPTQQVCRRYHPSDIIRRYVAHIVWAQTLHWSLHWSLYWSLNWSSHWYLHWSLHWSLPSVRIEPAATGQDGRYGIQDELRVSLKTTIFGSGRLFLILSSYFSMYTKIGKYKLSHYNNWTNNNWANNNWANNNLAINKFCLFQKLTFFLLLKLNIMPWQGGWVRVRIGQVRGSTKGGTDCLSDTGELLLGEDFTRWT